MPKQSKGPQGIFSFSKICESIKSYLAAERCEKIAIELEQSILKKDEKRVIDNFLSLMVEAKALKAHIAKITSKTPDVSDFERYGKFSQFF